jgi:deoxycytidylate deaminase
VTVGQRQTKIAGGAERVQSSHHFMSQPAPLTHFPDPPATPPVSLLPVDLIAEAANNFPPSTPHVSRVRDGHEQATVHAEQNAVADAARRGSSVEGCIVYVTHFPCINCAKILAAAGIAEIKYRADYLNDPLVAPLLTDAGVKVLKL